jgi:hypothetical protein
VRRNLLPLPDRGSNPRKILEEITMRFYRVHRWDQAGDPPSSGFVFFTTKAKAMKFKRDFNARYDSREAEIEVLDITPNKRGILRALERYASHENNG